MNETIIIDQLIAKGLFDILGFTLFVYILMIIVHETGHLLSAMAYGIKYKEIEWKAIGMQYPSYRLSKNQKVGVLLGGVFAGLLPLCLLMNMPSVLQFLVLAAYMWGCMKDVKKIYLFAKESNSI